MTWVICPKIKETSNAFSLLTTVYYTYIYIYIYVMVSIFISDATIQFPPNLTVLESDGELTFALLIEQEYEKEICVFVEAKTASTDQLSGDRQPATGNFTGALDNCIIITNCTLLMDCVLYVYIRMPVETFQYCGTPLVQKPELQTPFYYGHVPLEWFAILCRSTSSTLEMRVVRKFQSFSVPRCPEYRGSTVVF